jgi:hypothetical protein
MLELDLREQLPDHLLADPVTVAVSDAMTELGLEARDAVYSLAEQFSVVTATWALPEWERLVGITPGEGDSVEQRRTAIIAKLCSTGTTNAEMVRALAESITGYRAKVVEDASKYEFTLRFLGESDGFIQVDAALIRSTVELIKPAHLRFVIAQITWGDLESVWLTWEAMEAQFPTWGAISEAYFRHKEE